jgi:hypothetical protein
MGGSVNLIAQPLSGTHTISVAILSSSTTSALLQDDIYFGRAHQFLEAVLSIPEKSRDLPKAVGRGLEATGSAPELNPPPSPVSTIARTDSSAAARSKTSLTTIRRQRETDGGQRLPEERFQL